MPRISREEYADLHEDPRQEEHPAPFAVCKTCDGWIEPGKEVLIGREAFHEECAVTFAWRCSWCGEWSEADPKEAVKDAEQLLYHRRCFEEQRKLADQSDKPDGR